MTSMRLRFCHILIVVRLSLLILGWNSHLLAAQDLAFLGPRGTYSEEAADIYRSRATDIRSTTPMASITDVVAAVASGRAQRGIIPVESTRAGMPQETSALLFRGLDPGFRVVAEITIPIDLQLLVKPGSTADGVREILSHPNALKEAGEYLRSHFRDVPLREMASTAAAAEVVAKGDGTTAAIAGRAPDGRGPASSPSSATARAPAAGPHRGPTTLPARPTMC